MIIVFHGENSTESRKAFIDLRKETANAIVIDEPTITIALLSEKLEGQGLFADTQTLFIEELFSKKKGSKEVDTLANFIASHTKNTAVVLWESKALTPKQLGFFKGAKVKKFDLPKEVFAFLDSILPQNSKKSLKLFHKTLETEEAEFIFFMMVRQVRILLAVLEPGESQIDEVTRLAPWQMGKFEKQARSFDKEQLRTLFYNLFNIEKNLKTGKLALNLSQTIDFLLINL